VWIAAVGDIFATHGVLASMYWYMRWRERGKWLFVSLLLFVLALLTKEIALTLPVLLVLLEVTYFQNLGWKSVGKKTISYFLILISYVAYRQWAIGITVGYYAQDSLIIDIQQYVVHILNYDLNLILTGQWRIAALQVLDDFWFVYAVMLVIVAVWGGMNIVKKKYPEITFAVGFWLMNIALVSPLMMGLHNDEGERYGYIASVGAVMLFAWVLSYLYERKKIVGMVVTGVFVISCGYVTIQKSYDWDGASKISYALVQQLDHLDMSVYVNTYVIGLPDTYKGAQVMRNGLPQAVQLYSQGNIVRVPVYVMLEEETKEGALYSSIEMLPDGVHLTALEPLVTGDATDELPGFKYELWNYDYETMLSDTIRLQLRDGQEFAWARGEVQIVYYDGGVLQSLKNSK
jgi:hypothetical protein